MKMLFNYMNVLDEALEYNPWVHNYRMHVYYDKFGRVTESHTNELK